MNWTGGQLRRHSARQGVLSKNQKQKFAKSRQRASTTVPRQSSTFHGVPDPDHGGDNRLGDEAACRDGQMMEKQPQNHTTSPDLPLLARPIPADSAGYLDSLKRRLLQDHDWAAVAAARPLEVTFTSAQEAEHFGKRRRLTETDRKRLSATHGNQKTLAFPKSHYWREKENALDHIQVKITGQPGNQHFQNGRGLYTSPDRHANHDFSQTPDLPRPRLSANARYSTHLRSDPSTAGVLPSTESAVSHRRYALEGKQIPQEQMNRGSNLPSPQRQQRESCTPTEPRPASPTLVATDSLSADETGTQSWLPQPTRRTHPSSPLMPRAGAVNTLAMAPHVHSHSQDLSEPFTRRTKETDPIVPGRIFGQLVRMRSTDKAE